MILKRPETNKTTYNLLDLLGTDEVALSKAFSFLLASDSNSYFHFLHFLGIPKTSLMNYESTSIITEKKRNEGRTDIELSQEGIYHIIIECKIGKGKAITQRTQYLPAFGKSSQTKKILCFLTQERDTNKQIEKDVTIKNTSWLEIIELFNDKRFIKKQEVYDFLKFATKNYKMRELKEILIQDLSEQTEVRRFNEFRIYRRPQTFGTPIYFAPYFCRNSSETEGITKLSRILGILTFKIENVENFRSDLESFSMNKETVETWMKGVSLGEDINDSMYTYYFLDEPLTFKTPLKKDGGKEKGRGKDWIAAMIPPNRCVSFTDFIKHIPELM